ncbi:hypothetical protein CYMTET_19226, partial [Cymbomonas tetramitiformis]
HRRHLVPAVDCLNHHATEHQVEWRLDTAESCINLVATKPIAAGEQICATYGDYGNDFFFLHYGFVPSKNMDDDVILFDTGTEAVAWYRETVLKEASGLDAEALCAAALSAVQREQARMEALEAEAEALDGGWKGGPRPSETGFRAVRSGQVDERLMAALDSFKSGGVPLHPLEAVRRRCVDVMNHFDSSPEEDAALLSDGGKLSDSMKLLMRYRLGKKVVLLTVMELCKIAIEEEVEK